MHNNNGSMECNTVALSGTRTTLPFAVTSIHPSILEQHFIPSTSVRQAGNGCAKLATTTTTNEH